MNLAAAYSAVCFPVLSGDLPTAFFSAGRFDCCKPGGALGLAPKEHLQECDVQTLFGVQSGFGCFCVSAKLGFKFWAFEKLGVWSCNLPACTCFTDGACACQAAALPLQAPHKFASSTLLSTLGTPPPNLGQRQTHLQTLHLDQPKEGVACDKLL